MIRKPRHIALMLDLEWPLKHHLSVFAGAQKYINEQDWESTIDEFVHDTLSEKSARSIRYDGVVARATKELAECAGRLKLPVVNVWLSSPVSDSLPGVFADWPAAGRLRAEHLLSRGVRNFGTLPSRTNEAHVLQFGEFHRLVQESGCPCTTAKVPLTRQTLTQWRKVKQAIKGWMEGWELPIGVYVGHEDIGRIVAQMCRERGWRVPGDVAIITGENNEFICECVQPTLTSVEVNFERIGYEAARLLDRLMDEKEQKGKKSRRRGKKGPEHIYLPPQGLVVRESTDFFSVEDELVAAAMEFISAECHNKSVGPDAVALAVSTEVRTLQRHFRKSLDRPIAAVIRQLRIERAKRELIQSDRTMASIASDVGFGDPSRMWEIFCREVGVTPTDYRKQRQIQPFQPKRIPPGKSKQ